MTLVKDLREYLIPNHGGPVVRKFDLDNIHHKEIRMVSAKDGWKAEYDEAKGEFTIFAAKTSNIDRDTVLNILKVIDENSSGTSNYRDQFLDDDIINFLYGRVYDCHVIRYDSSNPKWLDFTEKASEYGYICHYCGFVFPIAMMDLDHSYAKKSKGSAQRLAILTVLLVHDLAETSSTVRPKLLIEVDRSTAMKRPVGYSGTPGKTDQIEPAIKPLGWNMGEPGRIPPPKIELNELGRLLLTLVDKASTLDYLHNRCLNSNLNLIPSCRPCNGKKSNKS
jgi:5-methylcytosine-specific restriction endonuclease McrA